jgi:Rieske 2Fe-2S family protein
MSISELKDMRQNLKGIQRTVEAASHAPGSIYSSEEVFRLEKENIFMKEWLCIARVEEVEKPGDYHATRIVGEPVLLARNAQGQIRAFANVCLHRGVEVASGEGNAEYFSCPYHAWTYDLDGNLMGASFMRESQGFDPKSCKLKQLHVGEWAGWIFVNLSDNPPPLAEYLEEFANDVGFLKMEDCRLGTKIVLDLPTNWKFVVENLMDVYHVRTLHYNSFGKHRGPPENYPFHLRKGGGTCTKYEARPMTPSGESLFGRMPAIKDLPDNFALSAHLAPNMQCIARIDNVHPLVMWPVTPTTSRTIVYNLYPKEHFALPDFKERAEVYDQYMRLVLAEDTLMMNSLQNGVTSHNYVPGRFSTLERGIHHVLNDYLAKVFPPA